MSSNPNPRSPGHRQPLLGPKGPGLLALVGYVGYSVWHVTMFNRIVRRHQEFVRKEDLIDETRRKINKLMSEAFKARDKKPW